MVTDEAAHDIISSKLLIQCDGRQELETWRERNRSREGGGCPDGGGIFREGLSGRMILAEAKATPCNPISQMGALGREERQHQRCLEISDVKPI